MRQQEKTSETAAVGEPPRRRTYLPLGIDVGGLKCVVVGGGRVGARKALTLARGGACVTVLSPEICERLNEPVRAGTVKWLRARYDAVVRARHASPLHGFRLVVAATDDSALNLAIGQEAERRGILSCVVSPGRISRLIFPATCEHGGVRIAVHTDGRDCGESRRLRDEIARILRQRDPLPTRFAVFGAKRSDLPHHVFDALARTEGRALSRPFFRPRRSVALQCDAELLVLATCWRWECYFVSPSPRAVIHDVRRFVHERLGVLLEPYRSAFYTHRDAQAFHHLLRVVSGLDSPLRGETQIVGQLRDAAERWLPAGSTALRPIVSQSLALQRKLRHESGLLGGDWSEAALAVLEERLPPLASRRVALLGCGSLARALARRLRGTGATVLPFSRRAGRLDIAWCSELGLTPQPPSALEHALPSLDALAVFAEPFDELVQSLRSRARENHLLVLDFTGSGRAIAAGDGDGWYVSMERIAGQANSRLNVRDALRIAEAEGRAVEYALRWHVGAHCGVPPVKDVIRLGARSSRLSLAQVAEATRFLNVLLPKTRFEVVTMDSPGDRDKVTPLREVAEDDFFTRDLDEALLRGRIDIAVHSAKDLPAHIRNGLHVAALTPAFAPWDCLVSRDGRRLADLPRAARVGASSERRRRKLLELRPDAVVCDVRGDVPERIAQVDDGRLDALVVAAAALLRLGLESRIAELFKPDVFPPAPAQGALALVIRQEDVELARLLEPLNLGDRSGLPFMVNPSW